MRNRLAQISDKSCLKRDLVFDGVFIFIHYKIANLDDITNESNKKWSYIRDHLYRILIINAFGSGKTNALINVINEQDYREHEILIKERENAGIKHYNDPNAFIDCFNTMDNIYDNINDYNPSKKNLVVFENTITDITTNKKFQAIINELLLRCRKLNISLF